MSSTDQPANTNKALWEKGDFTRIAASMRESGAAIVAALGVREGMDVLDLACGDGTTAVPEAQLGANVLGVDIARNLVAAGNARAQSLGLGNLRFQEGDASDRSASSPWVKAFDTFAPMGPCLLDANDVALIDLIVSVHFEGR
jgi:tRNA/tmRNA/rRNA uracil-C5-methylase (TrmA/RlmC/RlmD family)